MPFPPRKLGKIAKSVAVAPARIVLSLVYAYLLVSLSGFFELANAVVSCTDVVSSQTTYRYNETLYGFKYYGGKTYALALSAITGKAAAPDNYFALSPNFTFEYSNYGADSVSLKTQLASGKFGAARPVAITSDTIKKFILDNYGAYLGSDSTLVDAWKEYGDTAPFTRIDGSALTSTFWGTTPSPVAEPAAVKMGASGSWSPVTSGTFSKQIVEFDGRLDCAIDMETPYVPPPPPTPTPDQAALGDLASYDGLICIGDINNDGELSGPFESAKCQTTTLGDFCPVEALDCNTSFQPPVCPSGSVLNTDRDMCQADHLSVQCDSGYAWDKDIDKCVATPSCPDSGVFSSTTDRCEKLATDTCPSGYSVAGDGLCTKPVSCVSGGYNPSTDRCEASTSPECGTGLSYSAATNKCEGAPTCPNGGTYSATYNKCLTPVASCANGYSWNTTRQRCEKAPPACVAGTTYNAGTNRCEATPTCSSGTYDSKLNLCHLVQTPLKCLRWEGDWCVISDINSWNLCHEGLRSCQTVDISPWAIASYVSWSSTGAEEVVTFNIPAFIGDYYISWNIPDDASVSVKRGGVSVYSYSSGRGVSGSYTGVNNGAVLSGRIAGDDVDGIPIVLIKFKPPSVDSGAACPVGASLDAVSDKCVANPTCTGGQLDGTNDVCYYAPTTTCGTGFTYDSVSGQCSQVATCQSGSLDPTADLCIQEPTMTCLSGTNLDAISGFCISEPVCDLGTYDAINDRCFAAISKSCGTYNYDVVSNKCVLAAVCPGSVPAGSLNYSTDLNVCVSPATHTCESSLTWTTVPVNKCEAAPICMGAIYYDPATNQCLMSAGCPYGDQFKCMPNSAGTFQCSPYECVNAAAGEGVELEPFPEEYLQDDGPKDEQGKCLGQIYIFNGKPSRCRPPGWTVGYINNCCAEGDLMPEDTGSGVGAVSGAYSMYKAGRAAYDAYTGYQAGMSALGSATSTGGNLAVQGSTAYVSGYSAAQAGTSMAGNMATNALQAAGPAVAVYAAGAIVGALGGDQDAQMLSQIATMSAIYAMAPALLSGPQAIVGIVVIVVMRFVMGTGCDANDIMTANDLKSNRCHYIGTYCEKKIFGTCVQKAKGHCCFNSILSRIIHEQGRPQLIAFQPGGAWGPEKKPNCRGFTPEEFQSIDFSKIDLTEYYGTVLKDIEQKVQGAAANVSESITNKFEQIQGMQQ